MDATDKAPPAVARAAVFGLFAALTSSVGQTYFIGLFGGFLRQDHALTASELGALYGASTLVSGALMFWLGASVDRVSLKRVVPVAVAILAAGSFVMSAAHGALALAVAFVLLRFGGQGMMSHLAIVAAARSTSGRRGRNVAVAVSGFIIGEALWPALITAVLAYFSWRLVWLSVGIGIVCCALPTLWALSKSLPFDTGSATPSHGGEAEKLRRNELLKKPQFLAALGIVLIPSFVVTAVFFHLSALGELHHWSPGAIASGFVVFAGVQISATALTGKAVDRFGALALLRFHLLPLALSVLALGLVDSPATIWITFAGLGATAGANSVASGALWPELFGAHQIGMVRGAYAAFTVAASALSPFLFGELLPNAAAFSIASVSCALYCAAVPMMLVRTIRKRVAST